MNALADVGDADGGPPTEVYSVITPPLIHEAEPSNGTRRDALDRGAATDDSHPYFVPEATGVELIQSWTGGSPNWFLSYCLAGDGRALCKLDPDVDLLRDLYPWTDTAKVVANVQDQLSARYYLDPPAICEVTGEDIVARWDLVERASK